MSACEENEAEHDDREKLVHGEPPTSDSIPTGVRPFLAAAEARSVPKLGREGKAIIIRNLFRLNQGEKGRSRPPFRCGS